MSKHPRLADKLVLLYSVRVNPLIRTHADLGRTIGTAKQTISKWIHGTPTSLGDRIPHGKVPVLSKLFGVGELWWTLPFEDFEQKVKAKLERAEQSKYVKPDEVTVSFLPITGAHVYGRDKELAMLDEAWTNSRVNIFQLLAFGGVGKSSLVNAWLASLARDNYRGAIKVYAWSFYWQGASSDIKSSGDYFIEHALTWFGDSDPVEGTPWAKAARLVKLVRATKTLLVLDGLEPLQHPPGPKTGQIDNPAIAYLVKELAFENNGLCLITSRLSVGDIASFEDGRVRSKQVEYLSDESSVLLLRTMGVVGNAVDFTAAARVYTGHALSLSLLAGYLKVVHRGNLGKYREIDSLLDDQNNGDHARNLMQAYLDWFAGSTECELLYLVGLFDRAVALKDIQKLCRESEIAGLTSGLARFSQVDWMYAIKQLEESRIITADSQRGDLLLDCHPLVRDFLAEKLGNELPAIWCDGNTAIFYFLQKATVEDPNTMAELEPLFRAVIHGTRAGLYKEAYDVYFAKIKKGYSMLTKGSHYADQACIKSFFIEPWSLVQPSLSENAKFYLLVSAATNLMSLGQVDEAIEPSYSSLSWFIKNNKYADAVNIAGPLVSMLIAAGRIGEATRLLETVSKAVKGINNPVLTAIDQNFRAYINYLLGSRSEAKALFEESDKVIVQLDPGCLVTFPTVSSYYCKFLLEMGDSDAALERALKTVAWRQQKTWQVAVDTTSLLASDLMVLGLIFLERGDYANAKLNLDKQVELLKSADEWLYLPVGLNARAIFYIKKSEFSSAAADLRDALDISRRTGAKFGEWESYLNFAHLHLAKSEHAAAGRFLDKARSIQGMEQYKFRNAEIAELEKAIFAATGAAG